MVAELYKLVVGQGWVSRTEFWSMHPVEVFWLIDARMPKKTYAGGMSEDEVADIHAHLKREGHL